MTRLERAEDRLLRATGVYLDELGWNALVACVTGIVATDQKCNFLMVTKFTGSAPRVEDAPKPKAETPEWKRNQQRRKAGRARSKKRIYSEEMGVK